MKCTLPFNSFKGKGCYIYSHASFLARKGCVAVYSAQSSSFSNYPIKYICIIISNTIMGGGKGGSYMAEAFHGQHDGLLQSLSE